MLIDVDNVNQAESHKWVHHISKTHMTHVLYPIFQEKSTENGLRYVRDLQVKIIDGDNVNQAKYHKWVRHIFKNKHNTCLISTFSREVD